MVSIPIDYTSKFLFASICTREDTRIGTIIDFTPEAEDKFISEAVSQKLDRPLVNPSNKVWRYSTQNKAPTVPIHIGDSLR